MKDKFNVGANVYYSPSWLKTGAYGTYASVTGKATLPSFKVGFGNIDEVGWSISGELGHYWLGTTKFDQYVYNPPINLPDYTTWNVGVTFSFTKVFSFDVRYYDTNLTKVNCNILTGDPNATFDNNGNLGSKWCGSTVIGALKFDLTAVTNLK